MTFKKMTKADWDAVMRTNLDSCFNMTKQVMDGMLERSWGRVINVASVNGQKGAFGQTNYSAAKAGIHGFTKALALECARKGVTVNTISPGYIGTKMVTAIPKEILDSKILPQIPIGRLGKPEEVAGLIIYLCSEEAAFVTGREHLDQRRSAHVLGGQARVCNSRRKGQGPATGSADQEVPEPASLRHQDVELHHARRRQADGRQAGGLPGHRRQERRRPDAADPAADHSRGGKRRVSDVLFRPAVADDPLRMAARCRASWARTWRRTSEAFQQLQKALQEQSQRIYGDNSRASQDLWAQFMNLQGPAMQSLMRAYMEQSQKVFSQFHEQMQSQARNMFTGFTFPGLPGAQTKNDPDKNK
jgi:hypothetical protein